MRVDIITLFPELIQTFLEVGVTRRAYESGQVAVHCWNPRDYADGNYRRVDDRPFGGGPGMVMLAEPLAACLGAIRQARGAPQNAALHRARWSRAPGVHPWPPRPRGRRPAECAGRPVR